MGPLRGLKVIELAGLGPTPFCGMLLGDMGADVLRVDRLAESDLGVQFSTEYDLRSRNKRSIAIDIKSSEGKAVLMALVANADILVEGFRPGVAERLGVGPEDCWKHNRRLVYGRATGWGQTGPLANVAGHDINYIALSGALACIGPAGAAPVPPLNLLGDYGGGGLYLAFGLLCAVHEARASNEGQVVDAAMLDGVSSLMTVFHAFEQTGDLVPRRGANLLDGGAPYYGCYATLDGKYMAVGAIEAKFYAILLDGLGLDPQTLPNRDDRAQWPALRSALEAVFLTHTRADWTERFAQTDACVSPVLELHEVAGHPHNQARALLAEVNGIRQPRPAPRLSRTPGQIARGAPQRGEHTLEVMAQWGVAPALADAALSTGAVASS